LEELTRAGRVEVLDLARRYDVSEHTIRRDLNALAGQGVLQKTHGGAVALNTAHLTWGARTQTLPAAKEQIGALAAQLIEPGQTVMLEAGSTTLSLARQLTARPLTVITNSLDIAALLDGDAGVTLIVTGGVWQTQERAFWGVAAGQVLGSYRADWAILGTCALHPQMGATATHEQDAVLKRAMVAASLRTMVLADHSKRDQVVTHLVLPTTQLDLVVTDQPWPELEALGVQTLHAAGDGPSKGEFPTSPLGLRSTATDRAGTP